MIKILFLVFYIVHLTHANSIISINLYQYYNAQNHNTFKYEVIATNSTSDLLLRRGAVAYLAVRLRQPIDFTKERLDLRMMFGPTPTQADGSLFNVPISQSSNVGSWSATLHDVKDNQIDFKLNIPVNSPVGAWRMNWQLIENGRIASEVTVPNSIYILFNPWSPADSVYIQDRSDIEEYINNEFGLFYSGSAFAPEAKEWYYDQFRKEALQTAIYLLDRSGLTPQQRSNAILVSRAISQFSNSNDDNGVLFGKWEEPYAPYTSPMDWLGSGQILEQYVRSGGEPVKYGQCWVFAGITTTLSRALGIPSRTITNFASAHDTDFSLTIDTFYEIDGTEVKGVNSDSIWNFHVWSEVWIARPDLNNRFSRRNWQAIDATPQERSNNIFKMGPANVVAVKSGQVDLPYDLPFLYSEVNSDEIRWVRDYNTGRWRKLDVDTTKIGQLILTKAKSNNFNYYPQVATLDYKYPEGTNEERESIKKAARIMNIKYVYDPSVNLRAKSGDVTFNFTTETKQDIGKDMIVSYVVTNKVNVERTVTLKLTIKSIYYTGKDGFIVKKINEIFELKPKEARPFTVVIPVKDYLDKAVELSHYKVSAFLTVQEKPQTIVEQIIIVLSKPKLLINLSGTQKLGFKLTRTVTFKNPFRDITLTNCKLKNKKTAVTDDTEKPLRNIGPGEQITATLDSVAKREDKSILVMKLDCAELSDIRGKVAFDIKKNK